MVVKYVKTEKGVAVIGGIITVMAHMKEDVLIRMDGAILVGMDLKPMA